MSNELLFILHILLVVGFVLGALRWGASCLIGLVALQAVLANLFVVKQINLFGFVVTCSDVFAIGSILGLNLIQEYFGKEAAQKGIKVSFVALVFFGAMSLIHLGYEPAPVDLTQKAFEAILSPTPRIVVASLSVFFIVQKIDLVLFGGLKKLFAGKYLPLRMVISLGITQLIDTVLFSFLGLYGIVDSMMDIIILSFGVKCLIILASTPLIALSKKWRVGESVSI
jgi:uncharacterized integral membrane protein (TIGR00697 family)